MPPRQKSNAERQQARNRILDAARDLFVEQGVEAVTMREIAKRLDCSATALYLHFRDKEALIRQLCDTDFMALAQEMRSMEQIADPLERLRMLGIGYARFALNFPNHYRFMFMTPHITCDVLETRTDAGNADQDAYAFLQAVVAEAHAAGCFRLELKDPELIAQTLWAGIHGVCALEITQNHGAWMAWQPFDRRLEAMQDALLLGLMRQGARTSSAEIVSS